MAVKSLGPSDKFPGREIFLLENLVDTDHFALLFSRYCKPGMIVKITGPLGAGKTTFTRSLIKALGGIPDQVHSPTFSLVHEYETPSFLVNHCDFYRLREGSELEEFGGLEFFDEPKLFIIEWMERTVLCKALPQERLLELDLELDSVGRKIHVPTRIKILN